MSQNQKIKFAAAFAFCFLFRLLPFRPPNVEPLLATQMPLAKQFGGWSAFLFGFLSIVLFDVAVGRVGPWTLITAFAYGGLGIAGALYFSRFSGIKHYILFALFGTLAYDAITGLTVGPLMFNQSFTAALIGQIPFTLMHLVGNVSLSFIWSPFMEKWIKAEPKQIQNLELQKSENENSKWKMTMQNPKMLR